MEPMAKRDASVIAVDRRRNTADRLERLIAGVAAKVEWVPNIDVVTERFEDAAYDVLVITSSAFKAGTTDGIELLEVIGKRSPSTQIIFLMASDDIRTAMRAVRASSCQYVKEPASDEELRSILQMAIDQAPSPSPAERGETRPDRIASRS